MRSISIVIQDNNGLPIVIPDNGLTIAIQSNQSSMERRFEEVSLCLQTQNSRLNEMNANIRQIMEFLFSERQS